MNAVSGGSTIVLYNDCMNMTGLDRVIRFCGLINPTRITNCELRLFQDDAQYGGQFNHIFIGLSQS
jgi:hypothetical protein